MQPADVAAFKPLKTGWKKAVLDFRRKNPQEKLTKEKFAPVLKNVIEEYAKVTTIQNGFRASGLYPWDASSIDYTKCLGIKKSAGLGTEENRGNDIPNIEEMGSISYVQFKNIVGEEKINLFKCIESFDIDSNDEFLLLYKIYREFKKSHSNNSNNMSIDKETDNIDIIFEDNTNTQNHSETYSNIGHEEIANAEEVSVTITTTNMIETEEIVETDIIDIPENPLTNKMILNEHSTNTENVPEMDLIQENQENIEVDQNKIYTKSLPEEKPEKNIRDYVLWPKTPERKGKKDSKRLPFVLTSTNWKKIQMEKLDSKKLEEERKESRKTARLLKQQEVKMKETEKKKTTKRKKAMNDKDIGEKNKDQVKKTKVITNNDGKRYECQVDNFLSAEPGPSRCKNLTIAPKPHVVRKVFSDDEDVDNNKHSEYIEFPNNISAVGKMCFICTGNITLGIRGIRCCGCSRTYHNKCVIKLDTNIDKIKMFFCKTCLDKKM